MCPEIQTYHHVIKTIKIKKHIMITFEDFSSIKTYNLLILYKVQIFNC